MKSLHSLKTLIVIAVLVYCPKSYAQPAIMSAQDSVNISRYVDSAFQQELFSGRRQLYLDSALAINPTYAYLWQQKSMPLVKQKKYEIAMPYLDKAVQYDTKNTWLQYRAFIKCIFQKSYKDAIVDFKTAKRINSEGYVMDHPYDFYIGLCYLQLNSLDSAAYYIEQCIDKKSKERGENWVHYLHWFYMGIITYEKEDYTKAIAYFNKSLIDYKQFSDAQYYIAQCYLHMNDKPKALTYMEQASANLQQGYTINEDNSFYETYPYQLNKFFLDGMLRWLKEDKAKQ